MRGEGVQAIKDGLLLKSRLNKAAVLLKRFKMQYSQVFLGCSMNELEKVR